MPTVASIVSLKVAPKRSSDHSFNIAGIIETRNVAVASLGKTAVAYDTRATLYSHLADPELDTAVPPKPTGKLIYDSAKIRQTLLPVSAYSLSNEAMASDLDQAILRRQTQYLTRNQFISELTALVQATYPAKKNKLEHLLTLAENHFRALDAVYNPGGGTPSGVTNPKIVMGTRVTGMGSRHEGVTHVMEGPAEKQTHNSASSSYMTKYDPTAAGGAGAWVDVKDPNAVVLSQETIMISENEELRDPNLENQIRHERVTADLMDEILAESAFNLTVPNLPQIWRNELAAIDLEIQKLQIQFIETFLSPRLDGIVTAVMKDSGDNVRAGESVFRIEGNSDILLAGQVKCRAPISIGQPCVVETSNVFASDPAVPLALNATVVSIRGYDSEKDRWNIVLEAQNPANPRLPLGYDFEPHPDYSKITF